MNAIQLNSDNLIASGWHRECYAHPENSDLCIKVVVNGDHIETRREQNYYRLLEKRLTSWHGIPKFHGNVETNKGNGAVFDLIRDADGSVSKTLAHYLENKSLFEQYSKTLQVSLKELYDYQLKNNVLTMSLKPKNLLFQLDSSGQGKLQIVDNLGNADFIPLASYLSLLGKAKIKRKWKRFHLLLTEKYPQHSQSLSDLKQALFG